MKTRLLALTAALIVTAFLPLLAVGIGKSTADAPKAPSQSATPEQADSENRFLALVAAACEDDFCPEATKAAAIIINTCLSCDKSSFDAANVEDYASGTEFDEEQVKAVKSGSRLCITIDGEIKYIPFSKASRGYTQADEKYPYLCEVASPWDCFDADFDKNAECTGVSLSGINHLCQNGCSAEEAIRWYLPGAEIK